MNIYVDADACPVVDSIIAIAKREQIPVILVKNFSHYSNKVQPEHVEIIYVDKGADVADFRIVKLANKHDIVVTQDYGLASLCLGKGVVVLNHKGFLYTRENIDRLLHSRYIHAKARKSGFRTKGPKAFTKEDEETFRQRLIETIAHIKKSSNGE